MSVCIFTYKLNIFLFMISVQYLDFIPVLIYKINNYAMSLSVSSNVFLMSIYDDNDNLCIISCI